VPEAQASSVGSRGSKPKSTSAPSDAPPPSVSASNGSRPRAISSPSSRPSPSVSASSGLRPPSCSNWLVRPSLSKSSAGLSRRVWETLETALAAGEAAWRRTPGTPRVVGMVTVNRTRPAGLARPVLMRTIGLAMSRHSGAMVGGQAPGPEVVRVPARPTVALGGAPEISTSTGAPRSRYGAARVMVGGGGAAAAAVSEGVSSEGLEQPRRARSARLGFMDDSR
jgi:hypothetical protein